MITLRSLLNTRSRYIVLIASLLLIPVLILTVVRYGRLSTSTGSAVTALDESEQAWMAQHSALRIAGRWEEPPFAYFDEAGTYRGYEVDLARSLGPVLGLGIELVPMPREEAVIAMANGEIDAIMGMVPDVQGTDRYDFTEPYNSSSLTILVRSGRFDVTRLEDLHGHEVAVQADTAVEGVVKWQPEISAILVQSAEQGLELLVDEEVSAFLADEIVGLRAAQLLGLEEQIKLVGLPIATVNYSFAVPKAEDELLGVLNHALVSIQEVGLKEQVDRAWLGMHLGPTDAISAANSTITVALGMVVGGLVLGNVIYFLQKMRRRTKEFTDTIQESRDKYRKQIGRAHV